jgi:predicted MFS family arabinose efflux permease
METTPRHTLSVGVVYSAALVQGLCVVSYPASASVLKQQLSDAEYGTLFLPQMLATVLGSALGARLGPRALHVRYLQLALLAAAAAEGCLLSVASLGSVAAYLGTFALGIGFGLSAAPLNGYPARLFPARPQPALIALHTALAAGFALGPSAVSAAETAGVWWLMPALTGVAALALALLAPFALGALPSPQLGAAEVGTRAASGGALFALAVVLYALCEGTFANWCVVYLREERGASATTAALALSLFWAALALGRLAVSSVLTRVPAEVIWRALPVGMCAVFLLLPLADGPVLGVVLFALAGLACSAFFPLTVSLAAEHVPGGATRAASILTAALMVGVGLGSFAVGPLRTQVTLASLYRASAAYPAVLAALCGWLTLQRRRGVF